MAEQGLTSELRTLDTLKDPWAWGWEPLEPFLPLGMESWKKTSEQGCMGQELLGSLR